MAKEWLAFTHKVKSYTALQVAAVLGHTHLVETLIIAGVDINAVTVCCWRCEAEAETDAIHDITPRASRKTPLHLAICHHNWDTAKAIIRHGSSLVVDGPDGPEDVLGWIDYNGPNIRNLSALHDLIRRWAPGDEAYDFADWLVTHGGIDINTLTNQGMTHLATACAAGQFKLAHRLLSLGTNCNDRVPTRPTETLIHVALRACNDMGMRRLAVNAGDHEYLLSLSGRDEAFDMVLELVQLLLHGVDVDATDASEQMALHVGATFGGLGVIELPLGSGAKPELRDTSGATPLDLAKKQSPLVTPAQLVETSWLRAFAVPYQWRQHRHGTALYSPRPRRHARSTPMARSSRIRLAGWFSSSARSTHRTLRAACVTSAVWSSTVKTRFHKHVPNLPLTYRGGNSFLRFAFGGVAAVFWVAEGRPRVILKLKTHDNHVKALREHIVRVEFRDSRNKTCFLRFVLPFVLNMEEKSRSFVRRAWRKGTM
ncbi:putative ankyrin repeat protein RF_0381 [Colletotrichum liriopes]|uniref:Ankyrin repeat protein RF_0381 n=1 Tax=Colletotrichum liriopes TaxID=708192 RepID=A0AA37H096_9PEZI|nr:putative ankyrin repeat protein RF_0381 [Colletotrichum liriopes]